MNSDLSLRSWILRLRRIAKPTRAGSKRLLKKLPKPQRGGFLGFGGVAVSDAEKATLAQIAAALQSSSPGGAQA